MNRHLVSELAFQMAAAMSRLEGAFTPKFVAVSGTKASRNPRRTVVVRAAGLELPSTITKVNAANFFQAMRLYSACTPKPSDNPLTTMTECVVAGDP